MNIIPPKREINEDVMKAEKTYRTALSNKNYLKLETEAIQRGTTAYKLTQGIVTLYLNNGLINVLELPESLQSAIRAHIKENA